MNDQDRAEKDAKQRLIDAVRESMRWRTKYEMLVNRRGLKPAPRLALPDFESDEDAKTWAGEVGDLHRIESQSTHYVEVGLAYRDAYFGILNGG